jgi:hypothetical protein
MTFLLWLRFVALGSLLAAAVLAVRAALAGHD